MKKILFITATPTVGGNGDTLIKEAMQTAKSCGAEISRVDLRDLVIHPCKACYQCAANGVCVQNDDFPGVLELIHNCDGIIADAPVYYNCMSAQAITAINRLCCTFACKSYQIGPKKKVGVFLTCTGSEPEEMKRHVSNILTLPSVNRAISEYRTEVFTNCVSSNSCRDPADYLERARQIARWVAE